MNIPSLERSIFPQIYNNHILPPDVTWFAKRVKIIDTKSKAPGTAYLTQENFWRILRDEDVVQFRMTSEGSLFCFCFGIKGKF
nr:hypothetical protein MarFTME_504 [Marseillevirus futianmevirus]